MKELPQDNPYWIELCDVEDRLQIGTYIVNGVPAAGYERYPNREITARLMVGSEHGWADTLDEVKGRGRGFNSIEHAKRTLAAVAVGNSFSRFADGTNFTHLQGRRIKEAKNPRYF